MNRKVIWIIIIILLVVPIGFYFINDRNNLVDTYSNSEIESPNSNISENSESNDPDSGNNEGSLSELQNKKWQWERTLYEGNETVINDPESYMIIFRDNSTFASLIDCNTGTGNYTANDKYSNENGGNIKMTLLTSTFMQCSEDSKSQEMINMIEATQDYRIENEGEVLVFSMPASGPVYYYKLSSDVINDEVYNTENATVLNDRPLPVDDPLDGTYEINRESITFTDGVYTSEISGSSSVETIIVWGGPEYGDLTKDGIEDAGLMFEQSGSGSGIFYYIGASVLTNKGYIGTNAILLGDRISPQNFYIENGQLIVNYADRPEGSAMTEDPSIGVTKRFEVEGFTLVEVVD